MSEQTKDTWIVVSSIKMRTPKQSSDQISAEDSNLQ